jgi:hypothetical protein
MRRCVSPSLSSAALAASLGHPVTIPDARSERLSVGGDIRPSKGIRQYRIFGQTRKILSVLMARLVRPLGENALDRTRHDLFKGLDLFL